MWVNSVSSHEFPTVVHQWSLIDSVLFGPSSNPSKSGHLQAVTNFREKQFRVGSHVSTFLSDEAFTLRDVRNIGSQRKGDEGLSCQLRNRGSVTNKPRYMPSSGPWAATQDKYPARLQFQGLLLKPSRRGRRFSRHSFSASIIFIL